MKSILVPTDFSTTADKALDYAVGLAKALDTNIILLHCIDHKDTSAGSEETMHATLRRYKTSVGEQHGVTVIEKLSHNKLMEEVDRVGKEEDVVFIIMGTQGASGFKTAFFGTLTAAVIAHSTKPVITVPFDYEWKIPRQFLLALSDAHEQLETFEPVLQLGHAFHAHLKTVVFSKDNDEGVLIMEHSRAISQIHDQLSAAFKESQIDMEHLSGKDFHDTLQQYIHEHETDLLVMVTHKRSFLQNLIHFSVTRQMSYHTTVPLMSLHSAH